MTAKIRASSLDRLFACGMELYLEPQIDVLSSAAGKGTARHRFMEFLCMGDAGMARESLPPEMQPWADKLQLCDLPLCGYESEVEVSWRDGAIRGRLDARGRTVDGIAVLDFKSAGFSTPAAESRQLQFYSLASARELDVSHVTACIVKLYDNGDVWIDTAEFDGFDLDGIEKDLVKLLARLEHPDGRYRIGSHCTYCPGRIACPPFKNLVRRPMSGTEVLTRNDSKEIYQTWRAAEILAKTMRPVCQAIADAEGGIAVNEKTVWRKTPNGQYREVLK
jgi:hypothetical protein